MNEKKLPFSWKKIQDAVVDSAKVGSGELKRGLTEAKNKVDKFQLIHKRKELFAELGRSLYEANQDGLPKPITEFLKSTELHELINEISDIDASLTGINKRTND